MFIASQILGKKWMIIILQILMANSEEQGIRFSRIQREVTWVSSKVLTQRLRELEQHGLVMRKVDAGVTPPHVTYTLTEKGESLRPALLAMQTWGIKYGGSRVVDCLGQDFEKCRSYWING